MVELFEDLSAYSFHYPVQEWVLSQFRKTGKAESEFHAFLETFVANHIASGFRKYGEFDAEWGQLKALCEDSLQTQQLLVLLDQALFLEHDGNPIPNLR